MSKFCCYRIRNTNYWQKLKRKIWIPDGTSVFCLKVRFHYVCHLWYTNIPYAAMMSHDSCKICSQVRFNLDRFFTSALLVSTGQGRCTAHCAPTKNNEQYLFFLFADISLYLTQHSLFLWAIYKGKRHYWTILSVTYSLLHPLTNSAVTSNRWDIIFKVCCCWKHTNNQ